MARSEFTRTELRDFFLENNIKNPKISVEGLANIIGIKPQKISDDHFEEYFHFVFNEAKDVMDFAKSNTNCSKCKSFLEFMEAYKEKGHEHSKWWCCTMLAARRRRWGGTSSYSESS